MIRRVLGLARNELSRIVRQRLFLGVALAIAGFAVLTGVFQHLSEVEAPEIPTTAAKSFLETMSQAVRILALALLLLGSLAVAQESSGRTLGNLLVAPVRRHEIVLGKALALGVLLLVLLAGLAGVALGTAGALYDFEEATLEGHVLADTREMVTSAVLGLSLSIPSLFAWTMVGLMLSVLLRSLASALAAAGLVFFGLAFFEFAFGSTETAGYLFSRYTDRFPSIAADMVQGISAADWDPDEILLALVVSGGTAAFSLSVALVGFVRAELRA